MVCHGWYLLDGESMARIMVNDGEHDNHGSYIDIGMLQSYVEYR